MAELAIICKSFGSMKVSKNGKAVTWLYDYANDKPRLQSEMTQEEISESEKARWKLIKQSLL